MRLSLAEILPLMAAVMGASACVSNLDADQKPAAVEERYFECKVQPILTKSCSMFACHGSGDRYLRIYARNRLRLGGSEADRNNPMRADELHENYLAVRAMVAPRHPEKSMLLLKPLEGKAGGYFHRGATLYGKGNVFQDRDDPDYKILEAWVNGASYKKDPRCAAMFPSVSPDAGSEDAGQ